MAKIKMRNARAPSEGVPEPEVVPEVKEGSSGNTINVTVNVNPDRLSEAQEGIATLIREMSNRRPSIMESVAAAAASGVQNRIGFGERILRAERNPSLNSIVQSQAAQDMIERLSITTVLSRRQAQELVESQLRAADAPFTREGMDIAIDPAQPGSDRTVLGFPVLEDNRLQPGEMVISTGQRAGRATAQQAAIEAATPAEDRLTRLMAQFDLKSREALRREGVEGDRPVYGGESLAPNPADVRTLLQSATGTEHILNIRGIVYWGRHRRRVCIMDCDMNTRVEHRGVGTNSALVAFMVTNPRNMGMQPFAGSMQYNETIGFFVYNASQGGSL